MDTVTELKTWLDSLKEAVAIYKDCMADGKLTFSDAQRNAGEILKLIEMVKGDITNYTPPNLSTLTEAQLISLLEDAIEAVFAIAGVVPASEKKTTFKDISEILAVLDELATLIDSAAADGKLGIDDVLKNLGTLFGFPGILKDAIAIDGVIAVGELSKDDLQILCTRLMDDLYKIFGAIHKLGTPVA
jgi:hypothetical protein